jgi:aldehyde dehydrogenase (NAD+)
MLELKLSLQALELSLIVSLQPLIGAIAAGCCTVLKLSEIAPHYSALLSELTPKYLGSSVFKIVLGSVPETTELLELQCTLLCASHR